MQNASPQVTFYKGVDPKPQQYGFFADVLYMVKGSDAKLKDIYRKDKSEYDFIKKSLFGFSFGKFEYRNDDKCLEYEKFIILDIDIKKDFDKKINDDVRLRLNFNLLCSNPYTYCCFFSPNGLGFRVIVRHAGEKEQHETIYLQVIETFKKYMIDNYFSHRDFEEDYKFDTTCKNVSRFFYIAFSELVHFNPNSEMFTPSVTEKKAEPQPTPRTMQPEPQPQKSRLEHLEGMLNERGEYFEKGERNKFIYRLAAKANENGISKDETINYCFKFESNEFKSREIQSTVESAYKNTIANSYQPKPKNEPTPPPPPAPEKEPIPPAPAPEATQTSDNEPEPQENNKFLKIKKYLSTKYDFRLNTIALEIEISRKGKNDFKVLNENDLVCELLEKGFSNVDNLLQALLKSSFVEPYNPLKNYFDSLGSWDGKTDYISKLASYIDAEDKDWFNLQFKKALVRSVACALGVIKFNKHCLVLLGKQNDGKTSFIRYLCPVALQDYIKDNFDPQSKDGKLALCQNFIINLDELQSLSKHDTNLIKSLLTQDFVKERLPYDKKPSKLPRVANFFGSTNQDEFLTDETGNVRWLVMKINHINHDNGGKNGYMSVNIDKVWSQAYGLLKAGFKFSLDTKDIEKSESNNKSHTICSYEQGLINLFFAKGTEEDEFMTTTELKIFLDEKGKQQTNIIALGKALAVLDFKKGQKFDRSRGYQMKGFFVKRIFATDEPTPTPQPMPTSWNKDTPF